MDQAENAIAATPAARRIYSSRTLNLRSIQAIGYDMDYTLVRYRADIWERCAYERLRELLAEDGLAVDELGFDPQLVIRGLVIDTELGNIVKANRFGHVMRAFHGTKAMDFSQQRAVYKHIPVDLAEPRFVFLNTLFAMSMTCLYAQLVDLYDQDRLPGLLGYGDIYRRVRSRFDQTHIEGLLKARIMADPEPFIMPDPEAPLALLDQREAGKRLMLITNAEWAYTRAIMASAFDCYLPSGVSWRDLFELVLVAARKPDFSATQLPIFHIVDESGLLRPLAGPIPGPGLYLGGDATKVEQYLGLSGAEILYVGDHIWSDVRMSKSVLRWRTALILEELEAEIAAIGDFRAREVRLAALMATKEELEAKQCQARLELQRQQHRSPPAARTRELVITLGKLRERLEALDTEIVPLVRSSAELFNPNWGPLLRAGNDKSHLARQVERSADIYTSRVSNFLHATPFAYLRASRGSMPHDPVVMPHDLVVPDQSCG